MSAHKASKRVQEKIATLRKLETQLGHLPPDEWALKELSKRSNSSEYAAHSKQLEQQTETLFGEICEDLSAAGFSPTAIAETINADLKYEGGPRYCDETEVKECLENSR